MKKIPMKSKLSTILLVLFITHLTISCSSDDDIEMDDYPKTVNIEFEFTSDITIGVGQIETIVENGTSIIEDKSDKATTTKMGKKYSPIEVIKGAKLKITYADFSDLIPLDYRPYNIDMKIIVDDEIVQSKSVLLSETNMTEFLEYEFK